MTSSELHVPIFNMSPQCRNVSTWETTPFLSRHIQDRRKWRVLEGEGVGDLNLQV